MAGVPTRPCHAVSACRRLQGAYVRHLWCQMTLARRPGRTRGHMVRPRSGTYPWPTKHGLTPPLTPTTPSTGRFFGHNDVALWEQLMWRSPVRPPALGWPPALGGRAVHTPVVPGGCALTESLHTRYDKVTHRRYAGKRGRLAARSTGGGIPPWQSPVLRAFARSHRVFLRGAGSATRASGVVPPVALTPVAPLARRHAHMTVCARHPALSPPRRRAPR